MYLREKRVDWLGVGEVKAGYVKQPLGLILAKMFYKILSANFRQNPRG